MDETRRTNQKKPVRRLACFLQALLTYCPLPIRVQGNHIKGDENTVADLLSRFSLAPHWASVIAQTSPTLDLSKACQVPQELLSKLALLLRSNGDAAMSESENDKTVDSRAQVFTSWLASLDFDDESMQEITPSQALPLLGAFIHAVAKEGFSKTKALSLTAATISGHLRAARDWLAAELGVVIDISADDGTG